MKPWALCRNKKGHTLDHVGTEKQLVKLIKDPTITQEVNSIYLKK